MKSLSICVKGDFNLKTVGEYRGEEETETK